MLSPWKKLVSTKWFLVITISQSVISQSIAMYVIAKTTGFNLHKRPCLAQCVKVFVMTA